MHCLRRPLTLLGLILSLHCLAQSVPVQSVTHEAPAFQLPGTSTVSVYQTEDGFIWGGLYNLGVIRYGGSHVASFGSENGSSGNAHKMLQDHRGHLWQVGVRYNRHPGGLRYSSAPVTGGTLPSDLHFTDRVGETQLLSSKVEDAALDTHGHIWAMSDSLLYVYRYVGDTTLETIDAGAELPPKKPPHWLSVLPLADGTVWVSTQENVLYHLELPPQAATVRVLDSLALAPDRPIALTAVDDAGRLWGHVYNTVLGRVDPQRSAADYFPLGVSAEFVRRLDATTMMVPTKGEGLVLIDTRSGERRASFGLAEGLSSATLFDAMLSSEGDIWLAALDGLHRLPGDLRAYTHYTDRQLGARPPLLTEKSINNVTTDVWIRNAAGGRDTVTLAGLIDGLLIVPRRGEPFKIGKEEGLPINTVMGAVQDSQGGIYLLSLRNGACYIRPGGSPLPMADSTAPLPAFGPGYAIDHFTIPSAFFPYLVGLAGEARARLWLGHKARLTTFTDAGQPVTLMLPTDTESRYPLGVYQDEGNRLYGVGPWGVARSREPFTGSTLASLLVPDNLTEAGDGYHVEADDSLFTLVPIYHDGKEQTALTAHLLVDDRLWVAVDSRLLVVHPITGDVERALAFRSGDHECTALADGGDLIWAGTGGGLYGIRKSDLSVAYFLTQGSGLLASNNWSPNGLSVSEEGWVYQGTAEGLHVFRPELHQRDITGRPVYLTEQQYTEDAWGRNELAVDYTMLSYRDVPERIRYQTRLRGYDTAWSARTKETSLRYTNLQAALWPKTYFMQVRAQDYLGNTYGTAAAGYPVTVTPPLYLRWWAVLLYLGLLFLAIRAYTRYRLRQQEKDIRLQEAATIRQQRDEIAVKNEENETLLKEIHHRVKNNLEVVSSLLELQSDTLEGGGALDAMRAGQSRVASMGLLHQKLYQGRDLATVNMRDYLGELTESITATYDIDEGIQIAIDVPPDLDLDVDRAVPVGLIVNELVTNSLKYAFPHGVPSGGVLTDTDALIRVRMVEREQAIHLSVEDNGAGKIAGVTKGTGFGTRLVQLLTKQLEGHLHEVNAGGLRTEIVF